MVDEVLAALSHAGGVGERAMLIRGGAVLTMDQAIPDQAIGEVLVRDGRVADVGPVDPNRALDDGTVVVDAVGKVVVPGFVDTHRHCWQTALRRMFAGVGLEQYLQAAHVDMAPVFRPEDIFVATRLAAAGALHAGITTLLDFAHNCRTPAHTDAGLDALSDVGGRAIFSAGPVLHGEWARQWPADLSRLLSHPGLRRGLVTLRMAVFGEPALGGPEILLTEANLRLARDLGMPVSVDATFGPAASDMLVQLGSRGALGEDVLLIHCTALTDDAWRAIRDSGARVSLTTTSDAQIGMYGGQPPIQKALDFGLRPGLSVDVECSLSSDLFVQMQATYTLQRLWAFKREDEGDPGAPRPMSLRSVLEAATVDGAHALGLDGLTGSVTPGKAADLVLLDAEAINTMPLNNAVATVVLGSDTRNVEAVFVSGQVRKWRGELVGIDQAALRRQVHESRDYLVSASHYDWSVLG